MLDVLDADAVRAWGKAAVAALEGHQSEIDRLNVFPIADSDTGTNLVLTLRSAVQALDEGGADDAAGALHAFARGAVLGARGNSGVIVAQVLRSFAEAASKAASEGAECDAATLAQALRRAADEAHRAVAGPVDGTILTVARAAAEAAEQATSSLPELLCAVTEAADAALQATPGQLAVLAEAGVVDAGGRGLVLLLDALARTVGANPVLTAPSPAQRPASGSERATVAVRETGSGEYGYEVQYLIEATDANVAALRDGLAALGDSVVITGTGDGTFNVHVHVNDVGAAIEAGIAAGRPRQVSVVRFADGAAAAEPTEPTEVTLIAIAPGEGLGRLFESEGVRVVPDAAEDVLAIVTGSGAREVILLPNVRESSGAAEAVADQARQAGVRVAVVPTRSPVQGLAAVAVHDPSRRFDDDVVAMAEAAAATRFAEVTVADAEALTSVGICQPGDVLGLIDGEVVEIGRSVLSVALALIDRLLGVGAELITLLVGADATPGLGEMLTRHVHERTQLTEVQVYEIGQPVYPLIIGVE